MPEASTKRGRGTPSTRYCLEFAFDIGTFFKFSHIRDKSGSGQLVQFEFPSFTSYCSSTTSHVSCQPVIDMPETTHHTTFSCSAKLRAHLPVALDAWWWPLLVGVILVLATIMVVVRLCSLLPGLALGLLLVDPVGARRLSEAVNFSTREGGDGLLRKLVANWLACGECERLCLETVS